MKRVWVCRKCRATYRQAPSHGHPCQEPSETVPGSKCGNLYFDLLEVDNDYTPTAGMRAAYHGGRPEAISFTPSVPITPPAPSGLEKKIAELRSESEHLAKGVGAALAELEKQMEELRKQNETLESRIQTLESEKTKRPEKKN